MFCRKCGSTLLPTDTICKNCNEPLSTEIVKASDDNLSKIIPYRNVPALIAYYTGVFSIVPCLGMLLSLPAIILGMWGLRVSNKKPGSFGKVHAMVGIIAGIASFLLHVIGIIILSIYSQR